MLPLKFRAFDFNQSKYRTFHLSQLLACHPEFEFVDQSDIKQLLWYDSKNKEEFYNDDQICFTPEGKPLSIESAVILVDNDGNIYQWDERFLLNRDKNFPPWAQ